MDELWNGLWMKEEEKWVQYMLKSITILSCCLLHCYYYCYLCLSCFLLLLSCRGLLSVNLQSCQEFMPGFAFFQFEKLEMTWTDVLDLDLELGLLALFCMYNSMYWLYKVKWKVNNNQYYYYKQIHSNFSNIY